MLDPVGVDLRVVAVHLLRVHPDVVLVPGTLPEGGVQVLDHDVWDVVQAARPVAEPLPGVIEVQVPSTGQAHPAQRPDDLGRDEDLRWQVLSLGQIVGVGEAPAAIGEDALDSDVPALSAKAMVITDEADDVRLVHPVQRRPVHGGVHRARDTFRDRAQQDPIGDTAFDVFVELGVIEVDDPNKERTRTGDRGGE